MARKPLNVVEHLISKPAQEEDKQIKKKGLSSMIPDDAKFPDDLLDSNTISDIAEEKSETKKTDNLDTSVNNDKDKAEEKRVTDKRELAPIPHLITDLNTRSPNWVKTSHGVSVGSEKVLQKLVLSIEGDTWRPKIITGQIWNIAMIVLGEVLEQLPSGWEDDLAKLVDDQEAFCRKILKLAIETVRGEK